MADDTNSGGLYGLLGPGLRYVKGRLRILFGTDENSAVPGNLVPGPYPVNTTGATVGEGLVFDGTSYVPGAGGDAVNLASTAPTTITPGDSAAVGSATTAARANHRHAAPAFGTTAGTILEGSADAGMLHKAGAETITGHKRLDAQLRITPDTYPPTVGLFGCDADGSDPRSLINYSVYGGASQYRSLGFGSGAQPATLDSIGFQAVDSDTDDYVSASFSGSRLAYSFGNFTDPVLSLGEYTVYVEKNTLLWRNHYDTAAGVAVTIAGYSAGDTATDKVGGGLDLKPGEGAGNAAGAVLRLYAGATSTTPGTARNGWVLGLTVGPTAVTLGVPLDAGTNKLTNLGTPTASADAATKAYVDAAATAASGVLPYVRLAAAGSALPACTYSSSGGGGLGTLTANANGALTVDTVSPSVADTILVDAEVTSANRGLYTVTQVGDGSHPWILTRRSDAAHGGTVPVGRNVFVVDGSAAKDAWVKIGGAGGTIGTDGWTLTTPTVRNPLIDDLNANSKKISAAQLVSSQVGSSSTRTTYDGATKVLATDKSSNFSAAPTVARYTLTADTLTITIDESTWANGDTVEFWSTTETTAPAHTFACSSTGKFKFAGSGGGGSGASTAPWPSGATCVVITRYASGVYLRS